MFSNKTLSVHELFVLFTLSPCPLPGRNAHSLAIKSVTNLQGKGSIDILGLFFSENLSKIMS